MAIIHIDYTNGNDTTGAGTSGNPYKTLTKAFAVLTNADSIKIANTSAQQETNLAFPALTFSRDLPLIIEGWDNGGSIEINHPAGNITGVGEIHNSGTTNPLFSNTISFIRFYKIKFTDYDTSFWGNSKANVCFAFCEINNCYSLGNTSECTFYNNVYIGPSGTAATMGATTLSIIYGCYFKNVGGVNMGSSGCFINNIVTDHGTAGFVLGGDDVRVINNTFIGSNHGNATNDVGVYLDASSREVCTVVGNHFQDYNGSNSFAVSFLSGDPPPSTRGTFEIVGGNSFYNVTTDYKTGILACTVIDLTSTDITEGSDPLEDVANLEFQKKSTATSYQQNPAFNGFPGTNTLQPLTTGAVADAASGGGGGGTVIGGSWGFT